MKLDRNVNKNGRGKYAIVKLREVDKIKGQAKTEIEYALRILKNHCVLDFGNTPETDFFLIRLKDRFAASALYAYALDVMMEAGRDSTGGLNEYANEIMALYQKSNQMISRLPD